MFLTLLGPVSLLDPPPARGGPLRLAQVGSWGKAAAWRCKLANSIILNDYGYMLDAFVVLTLNCSSAKSVVLACDWPSISATSWILLQEEPFQVSVRW